MDRWIVYYKEMVMGLHLIFWPNSRIQGNNEKSELNHNKKSLSGIKFSHISHDETFHFSILMQQWVHNETFQDVSTEILISHHAAPLADSCFERQKLPLSWQNMYHMQCMIAEHRITSRTKWCNTRVLPSPYPIITRSCTDMLRTSTTSMQYIKI